MGFLGKIKNTLGQLTGGNGTMQVQVDRNTAKPGESITATLTLSASGSLSVRGVYIAIVGTEYLKYQVPQENTSSAAGTGSASVISTREESKVNTTYQHQDTLDATAFSLQQGETRQYTGTVQIPAEAQPTYVGTDAKHTWKVRAWADVPMGSDIEASSEITVR